MHSDTHAHMGHDGHGEISHDFRTASRSSLLLALLIIGGFFIIEGTAGFLTNSLALIADAGHLLTDVAALGLSLLAIWFAARPISTRWSFGHYRVEILVALVNGLALWAVAGFIIFEAYRRFQNPPQVHSLPMLLVAAAGFVAQTGTAVILNRATGESLNAKSAYIHVMTDAVQSVGVVIAGVLMLAFGWFVADPTISVLIALLITWSGGRIVWEAARVLLQATPSDLDLDQLCQRFEHVEGVCGVHDIHAWSLTTGYEVLSAHVTTNVVGTQARDHLLQDLREIAADEFNVAHITVQLEDTGGACMETHHIAHGTESQRRGQGHQ